MKIIGHWRETHDRDVTPFFKYKCDAGVPKRSDSQVVRVLIRHGSIQEGSGTLKALSFCHQ